MTITLHFVSQPSAIYLTCQIDNILAEQQNNCPLSRLFYPLWARIRQLGSCCQTTLIGTYCNFTSTSNQVTLTLFHQKIESNFYRWDIHCVYRQYCIILNIFFNQTTRQHNKENDGATYTQGNTKMGGVVSSSKDHQASTFMMMQSRGIEQSVVLVDGLLICWAGFGR